MPAVNWDNVRDSLVATGIWVIGIYLLGKVAPYIWMRLSQKLRPVLWYVGSGFARKFYVVSFVSALKRETEARSRVRTSKVGVILSVLLIVLFALMFLCLLNASVYVELIRDIAILLEYTVGNQDSAEKDVDKLTANLTELTDLITSFDSNSTFYTVIGIFGFMSLLEAIAHTTQQFRASLEIELQRINEYIKILASKSELSEVAALECAVADSETAGAYISRINEIAARHGLNDFDNMFPIVKFLRRLAPEHDEEPVQPAG